MHKILVLNNIAKKGLELLERDRYEVASEFQNPDAIVVRSANLHDQPVPASLKAVGRAGAGVNNIPVDEMTKRGIPVFNSPGANANAVKELVLAGMLLGCRNVCQAWDYVRGLEGDDDALEREVEAGKKQFRGFELPGRTLGVVGLGAIGVQVANAATALGMRVLGFDPSITVRSAWQMDSSVREAASVEDLLAQSDFVSFHVPLNEATENLLNRDRIGLMKPGAVVLNFARAEVVDDDAVLQALDSEALHAYVCDFPSAGMKANPRVISLPHLGASTLEAEENSATMAVDQLKDFLENGNIRNAVNFPEIIMPREPDSGYRMAVANANVPNMVGQITSALARANLNIHDMLNKSRGEIAYTLVDLDQEPPEAVADELAAIPGVLSVRVL